jgi:hypothetical protein
MEPSSTAEENEKRRKVMKTHRFIGILGSCLMAVFLVSAQALGGGHGITEQSLRGTYFIPCAEEGNYEYGGSIHVAGMGKAEFDGAGSVTITQQNVYTEVGTSITRMVMDGIMLGLNQPAQFSGFYKVNSEGFGQIYGGMFPPEDHPYTPSFLVTETTETRKSGRIEMAKAIFMIIPQNFVDEPNSENPPPPKTLIHVTARLR